MPSDCLFKAVLLTKNADPDKYGYSDYCTGSDARSQFPLPFDKWGKKFCYSWCGQ